MNLCNIARNLGIEYNVTFRVIDRGTGKVVSEHIGHNQATNSMMTGIGHYLKGDGVLNQGAEMLSQFIPRYISLGTMGLLNQDADENGLPTGIGVTPQQEGESAEDYEVRRYQDYMNQVPGYGADGYSASQNNGRDAFGLGPVFTTTAVKCELISASFPRSQITYREILPESEAELPETIDIVFGAYISTGALKQFRGDNDYVFITETGMWSDAQWRNTSNNGLLAAYRIVPPDSDNYDMTVAANRKILQQNILRVGKNQIVQVLWKIQLGSMEQFGGYVNAYRKLVIEYEHVKSMNASMTGFFNVQMDGLLGSIRGMTGFFNVQMDGLLGSIRSFRILRTTYETIMRITAKRGDNGYVQMAEMNFYDRNGNLIDLRNATVTTNITPSGSSYGPGNVVDQNIYTKLCGSWIEPTIVTIQTDYPLDIVQFSYTTADDYYERDPVSFQILTGAPGTFIDEGTVILAVSNADIPASRYTETEKWTCN